MKDLKWISIGILTAMIIYALGHMVREDASNIMNSITNRFSQEDSILTIGRTNGSIALDPAVVTDQESLRVTVNIYDNLVTYDKTGVALKPSLAENWSVSEDGLVWHFTIRRNVVFHDGSKLDADAVVFNFNRWMDATSPYHAGRFIYWNMNFGGFPGIVESVQSLSSDTVEIVLSKPYAPFLNTLAMPAFGIASPEAIMKYNEDLKYKPVGTGPFIFKSWEENGEIILERNNAYWSEKAKVSQLVFKTISDPKERIRQLKSGEILIADNLTYEDISLIKNSEHILLINRSFFNVGYLAMNMNNENLKIKAVRQAISHVIDKKMLVQVAFDGSARPATTFVPPILWGYNESIKSATFDIEFAKKLLNGVEKGDGFEIKLLVMEEPRTYFPKPAILARFIQESLAGVNIKVTVETRPWEEVLKRGQNGDYEMILAGWNGDVADPDNFLYNLFSSENAVTGTITNYAFYSNPQVDNLLRLSRQTTDQSFRNSIYRDIQELVVRDTPAIPLVHTIPTIGINRRVSGYVTNISGLEPLNHISLSKEDS
ncbi:ABC transporter substrate-binding protein [Fusibacter ferrireducens]|uniref:ABC transporter substrate-binding protein n=1 Tax=Fusibacter ferrireducens TaxID=2785058 RepID=A0ABR9ZQP7_9FIRM|nr:ABC transporter substrate-binding protein [Fusibacter ferrireducens]MBF4691954.1 ABC transporter substrate-binding protein [Fusibacter ferrireducens]